MPQVDGSNAGTETSFIEHRLRYRLVAQNGKNLTSKAKIYFFQSDLVSRCDGAGLKSCSELPSTNSWLSDGTGLLTGRDFISAIHAKYNVLYCKSRATRGRTAYKNCSAGCRVSETLII